MHEYALVSGIFNVLNEKIDEYKINKIKEVSIRVGDMTGVEDMTMKSCFEIVAKSTPVEGAKLIIEHIPVRAKCKSCGTEFTVRKWNYDCPHCSNTGVQIISGKELFIDSIEAE